MVAFSKAELFQQRLPTGERIGLATSALLLLAVALGVWLLLNRTVLGRGIYALGGDAEAARRVGFNLGRIQYFIYGLAGLLAGGVGVIHASHLRNANPFDIVGIELTVIAAVVLGGASITGGRGTVLGTLLGVFLLVIINNSLILVGIPSEYQKVVLGMIILGSTGVTAWRVRGQYGA
jgi:simple sugar transport system permease protein